MNLNKGKKKKMKISKINKYDKILSKIEVIVPGITWCWLTDTDMDKYGIFDSGANIILLSEDICDLTEEQALSVLYHEAGHYMLEQEIVKRTPEYKHELAAQLLGSDLAFEMGYTRVGLLMIKQLENWAFECGPYKRANKYSFEFTEEN